MLEQKLNKALQKDIVRTVAGFLNAERGGMLFIGVDDRGGVVGVEHDSQTLGEKPDRDGYENFLTTLRLEACGRECSPLTRIAFHEVGSKDVCRVSVKPAPKPAFVRDAVGEHLYVRPENSTRSLSPREAVEYCKLRWG